VTLLWDLHIVIKQQFFYIYIDRRLAKSNAKLSYVKFNAATVKNFFTVLSKFMRNFLKILTEMISSQHNSDVTVAQFSC